MLLKTVHSTGRCERKNFATRKLGSVHDKHFVKGKNKGGKPDKALSLCPRYLYKK
jgi:hypothetical protein